MYEGVSKSFQTGRLEGELQMVHLSATERSCITILRVSLVSFAAITIYVASQSVCCSCCLFRYRLSPETFEYTLVCVLCACPDVTTYMCSAQVRMWPCTCALRRYWCDHLFAASRNCVNGRGTLCEYDLVPRCTVVLREAPGLFYQDSRAGSADHNSLRCVGGGRGREGTLLQVCELLNCNRNNTYTLKVSRLTHFRVHFCRLKVSLIKQNTLYGPGTTLPYIHKFRVNKNHFFDEKWPKTLCTAISTVWINKKFHDTKGKA